LFTETFKDVGIDVGTRSGSFKMQCPRCQDNTSLSVDTTKGVWKCHKPKCDWHGGLKKDFQRPTQWKQKEYFKPIYQNDGLSEKAEAWFQNRGISVGPTMTMRLSTQNGNIVFPYYMGGEVQMLKYRDANKNIKSSKNPRKVFYGIDQINTEEVHVVEGEIDLLSYLQVGIDSVMSVPFGAGAVNAKRFGDLDECFANCGDVLDPVKKFIIGVDSDAPGRNLEAELARRFGLEKCYRIIWPEGCNDANDVLVQHGEEALRECINNAQPFPVDGLYQVSNFQDQLEHLYEHGLDEGISTGSFALDQFYTVNPTGELCTVTGQPGDGKSSFVEWLMINLINTGMRFGMFSPEHHPVETHIARLAELIDGRPFGKEHPSHVRMSDIGLKNAIQKLDDHLTFIVPDEMERTVDHLLELSKFLVKKQGVQGIILDPWNDIDHSNMGESETQYVRESLSKIRRFARNHRCNVWLIAHPTKQQKGTDGHYPVVRPWDISGSAHFYNMSDVCLSVFRDRREDDNENKVEIHVQKCKQKHIGRLGMVAMNYEYYNGRFSDGL